MATNFCENFMFIILNKYQNTLNDWFSRLNINHNKAPTNFDTFSHMQIKVVLQYPFSLTIEQVGGLI